MLVFQINACVVYQIGNSWLFSSPIANVEHEVEEKVLDNFESDAVLT